LPSATIVLVGFAAVLGLVFGSFADAVAYREPRGISLLRESRCDACDSPVRWYRNVPVLSWLLLRGRCSSCGTFIGWHAPLVEAAAGTAFAAVAWAALARPTVGRTAWWLELAAQLILVVVSVVLVRIDLEFRRLPNAIVLPSILAVGILLGAAALLNGAPERVWQMLIAGAVLFLFYAVIRLISPRGMGGGDVKLAALVGLSLGYVGWGTVVVGAFAAFLGGGLYGIVLLTIGRATRRTAVPFGPWMIVGGWVGALTGERLWATYIGMVA